MRTSLLGNEFGKREQEAAMDYSNPKIWLLAIMAGLLGYLASLVLALVESVMFFGFYEGSMIAYRALIYGTPFAVLLNLGFISWASGKGTLGFLFGVVVITTVAVFVVVPIIDFLEPKELVLQSGRIPGEPSSIVIVMLTQLMIITPVSMVNCMASGWAFYRFVQRFGANEQRQQQQQ